MLQNIPLHPIFFSIFPVLCGFSGLSFFLLIDELTIPVIAALLLAVLLLAISYLILKDWRKAGIVTSTLVLANFSFDAMAKPCNSIAETLGMQGDDRIYLLPYALIVALIINTLVRLKTDFKTITSVLNTLSLILVSMNALFLFYHEYTLSEKLKVVYERTDKELEKFTLKAGPDSPDIYYIILDAFGRSDTFKQLYDFDNSDFIAKLSEKGFTIAADSRSNYQMTCVSLPSSMNMEYLDYLGELMGSESIEHGPLYRLTQRSQVALAMKRAGYRFVNVRSGWTATNEIPEADVNLGFPFGNSFYLALIRSTAIGPLQLNLDFLANLGRIVRLYPFENIDGIMAEKSPKFVFLHITMPHPPFLFKEDGTGWPLDIVSFSEPYAKDRYIEQTKFVQKKVLELLDKMEKNTSKKVIIMQGDHGPSHQDGVEGDPSPDYLKERMKIFNAYKLPATENESANSIIYDGITPVNSFRVIFNRYFDANLPLLPDRSIYSPFAAPYNFTDVTKESMDNTPIGAASTKE